MRILQINTHRSLVVQDLAIATARKLRKGLLLTSEPNKKSLKNRRDWLFDEKLDAAIKILDLNLVVTAQGKGKGFVYVRIQEVTIFSCYASPNKGIEDLEQTLYEIERIFWFLGGEAIIAGDFNAKSVQWGMDKADRRGDLIERWMCQHDIIVKNAGNKPTFRRRGYGSTLDLTLVTPGIASKVLQWQVLDQESMSDHSYISFEVNAGANRSKQVQNRPGWNIRKIDNDRLQRVVEDISVKESETSSQKFSDLLVKICSECMPLKSSKKGSFPVYWWTEKIAELRRSCLRDRRKYTRRIKKQTPESVELLWQKYVESKKLLQKEIKSSKREKWKTLCDEADQDIWGKGYQIVIKRLNGFPQTQAISMESVEKTVKHLFPRHAAVDFHLDSQEETKFLKFTKDEILKASKRIKIKKAPGPRGIPAEILKHLVIKKPEIALNVYNKLGETGTFPKEWKTARLILLRKGNKPLDSASSYRPICLLDVEGKLYEQLILGRLKTELEKTGGLAENQFGFREGRQTVDAVKAVVQAGKESAAPTKKHRKICAVITFDVKNAFNSASWQTILDVLKARKVDPCLIKIIKSYLSERRIVLEAEGKTKEVDVNSGVPQGSVLGPTLWNVQYDSLLKIKLPPGVKIVGFADDIVLIVVALNEEILMYLANTAILTILKWMEEKNLQIVPEKTEAVLLTKKRNLKEITFEVLEVSIRPQESIRQLGVWLDSRMTFKAHVNTVTQKAEKTMRALAGIMPNIGGPRASKRRILSSVVHSQMLYAAPIWVEALETENLLNKLIRVQRSACIRVCSGYRTISEAAACVIAGIPPIKLLAQERADVYNGMDRKVAREKLMDAWQVAWDAAKHGRWTHKLIPQIKVWTERKHGEVDFYLSQSLSGHGCFQSFLYEKTKASSDKCHFCESIDTAEHTLFECHRWDAERKEFRTKLGLSFTSQNFTKSLIQSATNWEATYHTIRTILQQKENIHREINRRNRQ